MELLLKIVTVPKFGWNFFSDGAFLDPLVHTAARQSVSSAAMVLALTDAKKRCIKRLSLVICLLLYHNSLRDRACLLRQAVLRANEAPWRRLFLHGDSTPFLHMTGLTRKAYRSLLDYLFDLDYCPPLSSRKAAFPTP